jgi:hypothetical protein
MLVDPHNQLYYPFENQANDYSGHARHGTVFGSGVYATRPNAGRCLYLDGVGDYVETPSFGLSGTVVVFACNVRCKFNASTRQALIGLTALIPSVGFLHVSRFNNTDNLGYGYAQGTQFVTAFANNYFAAPYNDVWLHLVVICDYSGKQIYFYREGVPFGSPIAMTGTPIVPSQNAIKTIGSYYTTTFPITDGNLDNVYLGTLPSCPSVAELTATANRLMLGLHPIWSV